MVNKIKVMSLLLVIMLGCPVFAMEPEANFKIAVHNTYGAPIDITYILNGKTLTKKLGNDGFFVLGQADRIEGDIVISRSGAYMGYTAKSWSQQKNALWQLWEQKKMPDLNALLLTVSSSAGGTVLSVRINAADEKTFGLRNKFEKDVLDQFPALVDYGFNKKLTPDQIIAIKSPKEVVIKAGWLGLQGATTGEDIARYILGLPKEYDKASLDRSYRELALNWAPDKQPLEGLRELATKVMQVINHARDLLNEALREKGL